MEPINKILAYNQYIAPTQKINENQTSGVQKPGSNDPNIFIQPATNIDASNTSIFAPPPPQPPKAEAVDTNPFVVSPVDPKSPQQVNFGEKETSVVPENARQNYTNGLAPGNQAGMYAGEINGKENILGKELYFYG